MIAVESQSQARQLFVYSTFLWVGQTGILRQSFGQLTSCRRQMAVLAMGLLILTSGGCNNNASKDENNTVEETELGPEATNKANFRNLKPQNPGVHNQWWQKDDQTLLSFCLSVPKGYVPHDKVPLVLYLHQGANSYPRFFASEMLGKLVLPVLGDNRAIVVAPDIIDNSWFSERNNELVMALLEEICKTYSVDRQRILVMGYSIGANGVWQFASKYPDFFTAGLPIAGGPIANYAEVKWTVPMMCVQSVHDEVFPVGDVRSAVEELQKMDMTVQLHEISDASHYSVDSFIEPSQYAMNWIRQIWAGKPPGDISN